MSRQYDRYERRTGRSVSLPGQHRSAFGHWIPLALTITVATIGLAAWIWSERRGDDDEDDVPVYKPEPGGNIPPPIQGDLRHGETGNNTTARPAEDSSSYVARMSGALRRTPSPQQFFDGASRSVVAGVAVAGAAVGKALSSIREEDKNAYKDHKTWSEEVESRKPAVGAGVSSSAPAQRGPPPSGTGKKKTVAVVISADADGDGLDDGDDYHHEHASVLSHLPQKIDFSKIRLFVLIYAPFLKEHPLDINHSRLPASLSSSFSNIGHDQILTPGEEGDKPLTSATPGFDALWAQAQVLVEKDTMILPFTTPTGHVHILRHLGPDTVYLQESLAGNNGDVITHLQTWLRHDVILVVGADGGSGGLADSESEAEQTKKSELWWEREDRVGRGRGVVVVDGLRVGDDWARRIDGVE